jgi:tryptophan synthase beta subunit
VAALTAFTPTVAGVANAGAAVAASDTIDQATLGSRGVFLEIINGNASSDTVTIKDFGSTGAGNSLTSNQYTVSVTNGTSKVIHVKPSQVDPSTGLVTVTHSVTATVTYKMYSLASV